MSDREQNETAGTEPQQMPGGFGGLLGASPAMQRLFRAMVKISRSDCPLLIVGESGTGKELVARSIHEHSARAGRPFVPVDCGALAPTLIESELFGYLRGAFTGANSSRQGLLQAAGAGAIFLDEIGELPLDLQAKLLRVLQEREVRPLGSDHTVRFEARIMAATNRDLRHAVEQGAFRDDLYYRLNVVSLKVPALRERKTDIPLLVNHFLQKHAAGRQPAPALSEDALHCLLAYDWPGNVRELENSIERAATLSSGPVLGVFDLPTNLHGSAPVPVAGNSGANAHPTIPLHELERQAILRAVADAGGDKLLAARRLGIGKTTLYRKLKEYGC
jgi:two-component system response regulator HydG